MKNSKLDAKNDMARYYFIHKSGAYKHAEGSCPWDAMGKAFCNVPWDVTGCVAIIEEKYMIMVAEVLKNLTK